MIGNRYEYDAMAACEADMWWYRCLHEITLKKIKQYINRSNPQILDAGCGTGGLLKKLRESGYTCLSGFDLSADAVQYAVAATGLAINTADICALNKLYPPNYFDCIVSHDILCLLEPGNDHRALKQLLALLTPGGFLLMNLPAHTAFKGSHDKAVGIQQRYSVKGIQALAKDSATIVELLQWPFILSPAIFLTRFAQRMKQRVITKRPAVSDVKMPAAWLNESLYRITAAENRWLSLKPWGSSIFVVLQRGSN